MSFTGVNAYRYNKGVEIGYQCDVHENLMIFFCGYTRGRTLHIGKVTALFVFPQINILSFLFPKENRIPVGSMAVGVFYPLLLLQL